MREVDANSVSIGVYCYVLLCGMDFLAQMPVNTLTGLTVLFYSTELFRPSYTCLTHTHSDFHRLCFFKLKNHTNCM